MNKLITKIVGAALGLTMAIGVGVAAGASRKEAVPVHAADGSATISGGTVEGSGTSATITWSLAAGNITAVSHSGGGNAVANTNRLYRYNYIEFTASNNYSITSLEITYSTTYRGANNAGGTAITNNRISAGQSNVTVTDTNVSGGKITVTPDSTANTHFFFQNAATGETNTQLRWTEFKVNYSYESSDPSVIFTNPTDVVGVGSTVTNAANGENLGGATISYSTGNSSVATVSSSGVVTGVGFGSTTITATATVSGTDYSDSYTIYVTSSSTAYYTVAQARAAIDSGKGLTGQYVKGVVYQVDSYNSSYHSITYWISDDGSNSVPFEVYSGLGIGGANFSSVDDIKVGDIVVVTGELKKNGSTYEFNYNNELVSQISVASITIKTAPTTTAYAEGEYFDPTGLVVTATYNNNPATTMDFAYADLGSAFAFNPTTSHALTNETSVSITLFDKTTTQAITVAGRMISSITVTGDMTNKIYIKDAAWDYAGLSLTVTYDSGDPAVVSLKDLTVGTDFTVDKATADGTTSLTIGGTYGGTSITSRTITGITYVSEVTFTAGTDQGTSSAQNADSMLKHGITVAGTSLATTTAQYRIYKSSTLTISSSGEKIRKIEFTDAGDSSNPASNIALKSGESGEYADLIWLGNDDSVAFSPSAQARVSAITITTESGYQEVSVNGLAVNGEAATVGQNFNVEVVKNKTTQLNVAVTPDNTTESKDISYEVTSGTGATVSATGLITGGSTVGGTATIKATSVANSAYYVYFSVTVIDSKTVYDIDFNCSTSTTTFTAATWGTATSGSDADDLTVEAISKVYPDANAIKFGTASAVGSITLTVPDSIAIERVVLRAKSYGGKDTPTISVNSGTAQTPTEDWSYLVFDLTTPSDVVTIAGTTASNGRFYIDDIYFAGEDNQAAVGAYGYAAEFMNALDEECSNLAVSTTTWGNLNTVWTTMGNSNGEQTYFLSKTPSPRDGDGNTPTGDVIQKALARYDFIVGKYNKVQGLTAYTDFMSRDPSPVGSARINLNIVENNGALTSVIVIVSLVSITAIGGFFFLKKRKEQ